MRLRYSSGMARDEPLEAKEDKNEEVSPQLCLMVVAGRLTQRYRTRQEIRVRARRRRRRARQRERTCWWEYGCWAENDELASVQMAPVAKCQDAAGMLVANR